MCIEIRFVILHSFRYSRIDGDRADPLDLQSHEP